MPCSFVRPTTCSIPPSRVLEKLNLGDNRIGGKDDEPGIRALAEALQINTTITELNLAFTHLNSECAYLLAPAIRSNRALETITFGDEEAVTMNADMTEADFNGKDLSISGAMVVAAFLPKCR